MRHEALGAFVLRTFLWLPVCFAGWYAVALPHAIVAGGLAHAFLGVLAPGLVTSLEHSGFDLEFVTRIGVQVAGGRSAVLAPEVNPLIYTYGLAPFVALMLASRARWRAFIAGVLALLPFQAWGIAFDFLVQVAAKAGEGAAVQAGLTGWKRESIALAYQLGSLIVPALAPVALWAALNRGFIASVLARGERR